MSQERQWKTINWACQRCGEAQIDVFTANKAPNEVDHRDLVRCTNCKLTAGVILYGGTTYLEWAEDDDADFPDPFEEDGTH